MGAADLHFSALALDECEWSAWEPYCFIPEGGDPCILSICGWVGLRVRLDLLVQ
jgi:hypothetical protein